MESDPEDFAKNFCADMGIEDPEVGVSKISLIYIYFLIDMSNVFMVL